MLVYFFFFSSRRRHTRFDCDWSSDVCSSDLRPLRPATHRSLGEPLPHQLANGTRAPPQAPTFMKRSALGTESRDPVSSSGISPPFGRLFRTRGQVTHVLLTRSPLYRGYCYPFLVRLACVRHAASVRSEPGSNSPLKSQALAGLRLLWKTSDL